MAKHNVSLSNYTSELKKLRRRIENKTEILDKKNIVYIMYIIKCMVVATDTTGDNIKEFNKLYKSLTRHEIKVLDKSFVVGNKEVYIDDLYKLAECIGYKDDPEIEKVEVVNSASDRKLRLTKELLDSLEAVCESAKIRQSVSMRSADTEEMFKYMGITSSLNVARSLTGSITGYTDSCTDDTYADLVIRRIDKVSKSISTVESRLGLSHTLNGRDVTTIGGCNIVLDSFIPRLASIKNKLENK